MAQTGVLTGDVGFETSGSTGETRCWMRSAEQLACEVRLISDALIGPVDQVINYAPPQHLFGALFGRWLPETTGVPVVQAWRDPFGFTTVAPRRRILVVCVPMAWPLLQRVWRHLRQAESVLALHSTAAAPPVAYDLVRRWHPRLRMREIFGSTETGGIAHRQIEPHLPAPAWQGFGDVRFVRDGVSKPADPGGITGHEPTDAPGAWLPESLDTTVEDLVVASPRLARPAQAPVPVTRWATGDLVRFTGPDSFHLVGRRSWLVKVNGQRVYLPAVEQRLSRSLPGAAVVCTAVPGDAITGEGYAVFWSPGVTSVRQVDVRAALRDLPSPASIVRLPSIPTTKTGKPDRQRLAGLPREHGHG